MKMINQKYDDYEDGRPATAKETAFILGACLIGCAVWLVIIAIIYKAVTQ